MKGTNVLFQFISLIAVIKSSNANLYSHGVMLVEENDCNPKCMPGAVCVHSKKIGKFVCTCPNNYFYHNEYGCQKIIRSWSGWECYQKGSNAHREYINGYGSNWYCKCNNGTTKDPFEINCKTANNCQIKKNGGCPSYSKCVPLNNGKVKCIVKKDEMIVNGTYDPFVLSSCDSKLGKRKCIPPAVCTNEKIKNSASLPTCSCPVGMFLTRNQRQCAPKMKYSDGYVYSIKIEEENKKFPDKFKIYLDGCFNIEVDVKDATVIYQSVSMVTPTKIKTTVPHNLKIIHFKMQSKTLSVFGNDSKDVYPLFSTQNVNENCEFVESIEGLVHNGEIIKTKSHMERIDPTPT